MEIGILGEIGWFVQKMYVLQQRLFNRWLNLQWPFHFSCGRLEFKQAANLTLDAGSGWFADANGKGLYILLQISNHQGKN